MPSASRRQMGELAEMTGLGADAFKPVRRLSGGMQRKLEIIRGLSNPRRVLFLDEPTSGLDVASRRTLWQYIEDLRRHREITICLTTHQLMEAEDANRICILDHGRVAALGSPRQVKAQLVHERLHIDAADRGALRRGPEQMKLAVTEEGHFVVSLDGHSAFEVIHAIKEALTMLRTESPSLEDAYLRILETGEGA